MARSSQGPLPSPTPGSLAIVPAAGAAKRFGGAKLLESVGGVPLLERTVRSLLDGGVDRVVVVLGAEAARIRDTVPALHDKKVTTVVNHRPEREMLSSIQVGVRAASGDPLVILPGDMPYVHPATVTALLEAYAEREAIVSPRFGGKRGHPVVIPGRYRQEILGATAEVTLHEVLRAHSSERVDIEVYDRGVIRDIDVPSDIGKAAP